MDASCHQATEEEAVIYSRSTTRSVYASHMSNKVNRLRKEATAEGWWRCILFQIKFYVGVLLYSICLFFFFRKLS
jgi:hypothetical protein